MATTIPDTPRSPQRATFLASSPLVGTITDWQDPRECPNTATKNRRPSRPRTPDIRVSPSKSALAFAVLGRGSARRHEYP
jgi:hypothetical protein